MVWNDSPENNQTSLHHKQPKKKEATLSQLPYFLDSFWLQNLSL